MTAVWELSATELSRQMSQGELSSKEVVRAHLERIEALNPALNAFVEVYSKRALADAARCDEERARGAARGPLHGLPISVKECIDVAGEPTTLGLNNRRAIAETDAAIVTVLREAGAIPLGRTNNPQVLLSHETSSPRFGRTNNPFDPTRTPGGSSGGESAAIAAGLSPLGIGTDLGGSIRVPAHFTGTVGLKPTLDRWPWRGCNTALMGQEGVRAMVGPLARTTADLVLVMRALSPERMSELDARVPPLAWSEPGSLRGLRVGRFEASPYVAPSRAVLRAVEEAVAFLTDAGCEVVPFEIAETGEVIARQAASIGADGGRVIAEALEGETVEPHVAATLRTLRLPRLARPLVARLLERSGDRVLANTLRTAGRKRVEEYWAVTRALRSLRHRFVDRMREQRVALLVGPVHATPALPHGGSKDFLFAGAPSILFNALQLPAGVVPVTRVRADEVRTTRPRSRIASLADQVDRDSAGLPVGVQLVGPAWAEPLVLAAMAAVEAGARATEGFPATPIDPRR